MDILLIAFWFLLVILIPIVFFLTVNYSLSNGAEMTSVVLRSIFATVAFFIVSVIAIFMILVITIGPDPNPERVFSFGEFIGGLVVIFGYGAIGWGLCSVVAVETVNAKMFWSSEETQQSILE